MASYLSEPAVSWYKKKKEKKYVMMTIPNGNFGHNLGKLAARKPVVGAISSPARLY